MIHKKKNLAILTIFLAPSLGYAQPEESFSLPTPATQSDEELSQTLEVYVNRIEVRGVTAIDPGEIAALTAEYEGRNVSSAELQELRLTLSNLYLDSRYVNSGVILPDQSVSDGVIYYQAVEGELSRIEIEGDPVITNSYIQKRLARHIDQPVNIDDIRYALQYLQNDPNIARLDARLAPGDGLGQSVLRVAVDEPTRFEFGAGVNNHRATSTGENEGNLHLRSRNVTGLGEVIDVSTGISDGGDNTSIGFAIPISPRNTSLQAYVGNSDSSIVEARLRALDIESQTETRGIRVSHPFIDTLDKTLSVTLGYETRYSESSLGGVPFSLSPGAQDGVSETNVGSLGVDWTGRGDNHVLAARLTLRHGGDYQDATIYVPPPAGAMFLPPFNPTGADGQFDLVQTQLLFLRRIGSNGRAQLAIRASGQFSSDPLMSLEKIAIGGVNTVRGYPENFFVRDNGVAVSLEVRLLLPGATETPSLRNLSIVPFLDYGRSWDEVDTDTISETRDTSKANSITSLGVGLVWQPRSDFRAELYWGADIDNDLTPGADPRNSRGANLQDDGIHFALSYSKNW